MTRTEASDLLGVSGKTIDNWERRGMLHSRSRPGLRTEHRAQVKVFDPKELAKIPRRQRTRIVLMDDPDEVAARAFEMFDDGSPIRQVVVQLRKKPELIEKLHEQWSELGGTDLVITKTAQIEIARFVGEFASVADLVERVRAIGGHTIEATVPDGATDAEIEVAIIAVLDHGEAAHV